MGFGRTPAKTEGRADPCTICGAEVSTSWVFPAAVPRWNSRQERTVGTATPFTIVSMTAPTGTRLERVLEQLRLYEHPLLEFSARAKGEAVEVIIEFKNAPVPVHTYYFDLHPRDLDHPQFEWTFQRQLFDCLHDYIIEMFTRTPQNRVERQREGL
jgi:hypothetical protein